MLLSNRDARHRAPLCDPGLSLSLAREVEVGARIRKGRNQSKNGSLVRQMQRHDFRLAAPLSFGLRNGVSLLAAPNTPTPDNKLSKEDQLHVTHDIPRGINRNMNGVFPVQGEKGK